MNVDSICAFPWPDVPERKDSKGKGRVNATDPHPEPPALPIH